MASFETIAPELSKVVEQAAAVAFAQNVLSEAPPTPTKTIDQLEAGVRAQFITWLKWFGQEKRPANLPDFINWSPKRVARYLGMSVEYVNSLRAERAKIVGEVSTYADDAFKAHAQIASLSYADGDLTIVGSEFVSVAGGAMGVKLQRPEGALVTRTKSQIETAGGTFENTTIIVKATSIPTELLTGDLITVVADGLDSNTFSLVVSAPVG